MDKEEIRKYGLAFGTDAVGFAAIKRFVKTACMCKH
jgi:hypothetical protein